MKKNKDYIVSSGNVFADLELPNPSELLAKAELARQTSSSNTKSSHNLQQPHSLVLTNPKYLP